MRPAQRIGWVQHVNGWTDFCGARIEVDPGVFVPRRRTEFLVQQAAALVREGVRPNRRADLGGEPQAGGEAEPGAGAVVLDLCCGAGAVGAALSADGPIELHAADIDAAAVACARRNIAPFGGRAYAGDLFTPLPLALRGRIDLIVTNAPYVTTDESVRLPLDVRLYEPRAAFDGGADGLELHRRLVPEAASWLAPGGSLLAELHPAQTSQAARLLSSAGLSPRVSTSQTLDATVITGTKPSA
ncbi:methyltransferase [Streptomonospora wellingtoniae]|uniref:Methyltransferase n=1 Tax=Streptomonospora wellingtoniae TaxID=3075544 RepID=A0ABU2L103_9ACTN|nr:methyltransferase [Streptomonospora sp. DSM 45055]MDT0304943.1 methyltransferase [Streptomonospora sp. DSM 45055]